ncbi:hypothetical protein QBC35DRAFT_549105 [Podospora australis]|uniref:Uncharacterized protein n=1 Tax=Podospora australis TaxID=1536484 RepID=A0AAN7ADN0_9PEZI|nr:hypothetical protein QBC35DRAFT_549105 [Podospora australis]
MRLHNLSSTSLVLTLALFAQTILGAALPVPVPAVPQLLPKSTEATSSFPPFDSIKSHSAPDAVDLLKSRQTALIPRRIQKRNVFQGPEAIKYGMIIGIASGIVIGLGCGAIAVFGCGWKGCLSKSSRREDTEQTLLPGQMNSSTQALTAKALQ